MEYDCGIFSMDFHETAMRESRTVKNQLSRFISSGFRIF